MVINRMWMKNEWRIYLEKIFAQLNGSRPLNKQLSFCSEKAWIRESVLRFFHKLIFKPKVTGRKTLSFFLGLFCRSANLIFEWRMTKFWEGVDLWYMFVSYFCFSLRHSLYRKQLYSYPSHSRHISLVQGWWFFFPYLGNLSNVATQQSPHAGHYRERSIDIDKMGWEWDNNPYHRQLCKLHFG